MNNVPFFIINLPKSTDRKAFMKAQCENMGISPVFIDAVNGKELSKSDIERCVDQNRVKKLFGRELLLGEIGCALSHKRIYQKMVDENILYAVILEDDVVTDTNIYKVIGAIIKCSLPWELVLLGHHKNRHKGVSSLLNVWHKYPIMTSFSLNRLASFGFGTYGYIVTLRGAEKLLVDLDTIYKPIDHYTSDDSLLNVYALSPTLVNVNNDFESLIDNDSVRQKNNDKLSVVLFKKLGFINAAVSFKSFLIILKPIKKYK